MRWRSLEKFLLNDEVGKLKERQFRASNLGPYAYTRLTEHHPAKAQLKSDYVYFSARHAQFRHHVLPLVRAWREQGLEVAFIKGFYLAEFEYAKPAERFYGDVDLLINPDDSIAMKEIAVRLGWISLYDSPDFDSTQSHEGVLKSPDGLVSLELHGVVLQSTGTLSRKLAQAFWDRSTRVLWNGVQIRQLHAVDTVLCMYLNRAWGDYYARKIHDILDVKVIINKYGLTREELLQRASELGVNLALRIAMRTCDPWHQILRLGPRSRAEVWWDAICAFPDWRAFAWDLFWLRVKKSPVLIADVIEGWNLIRLAKRHLSQEADINKVGAALMPKVTPSGKDLLVRMLRLERGVRWSLRLTNQHVNACVPRSLALFHALRKEGLEVSFVSGIRRNGTKLEGHAWLELDGKPIAGYGDENAPNMFKENFRFPKQDQ
jgi:hypothetical protein